MTKRVLYASDNDSFNVHVRDKIPDISNDILQLIWGKYLTLDDQTFLMFACNEKWFRSKRKLGDIMFGVPPFNFFSFLNCCSNNYYNRFKWLLVYTEGTCLGSKSVEYFTIDYNLPPCYSEFEKKIQRGVI
jgi:hypothetical protein